MRPTSYLLPPRQRTIARFMNMSPTVDGLVQMQKVFPSLKTEEKEVFSFVNHYREITAELRQMFDFVHYIESLVKSSGLSRSNIQAGLSKMDEILTVKSRRVDLFKESVKKYMMEEYKKIPSQDCIWNASSDIIESLFGTYKSRRSPNSLNGVMPYVFLLPLLTTINEDSYESEINFKEALESVFLRDIEEWKNKKLSGNLAVKKN